MAVFTIDDLKEDNNNFTMFSGSTGDRVNKVEAGNPKDDILILTTNTLAVDASAPVGENDNTLLAEYRKNKIGGVANDSLQGRSSKNADDAAKLKENGVVRDNAIGSHEAVFDNDANPLENGGACRGNAISPFLTFQYKSPFVGSHGACGCWVSTGFDLLSLIGSFGTISRAFKAFKIAKPLRRYRNLKSHMKAARKAWRGGGRNVAYRKHLKDYKAGGMSHKEAVAAAQDLIEENDDLILRRSRLIEKYKGNDVITISSQIDELDNLALWHGVAGIGWMVLIGVSNFADLMTVYRPKNCTGFNTVLDDRVTIDGLNNPDHCSCVCSPSMSESAVACREDGWLGPVSTVFGNLVNFIPGFNGQFLGEEIDGCVEPCTCFGERLPNSLSGAPDQCICQCDPPDLDYNNGPCQHERDFDRDFECCCKCPEGSAVAEGKTLAGQARLSDNYETDGSGWAPSKFHARYSTGCSHLCDGRDVIAAGGTWPPECPVGQIFVSDVDVCDCVDAGTACFIQNVLYSTENTGPGSFNESYTCPGGMTPVVLDAGEEYESTECWCTGEPDPVDDEGNYLGECGGFSTAFNIGCRTDMDRITAMSLVGSRQVYNGGVSFYTALDKYVNTVVDCDLCDDIADPNI